MAADGDRGVITQKPARKCAGIIQVRHVTARFGTMLTKTSFEEQPDVDHEKGLLRGT